MKNIFLVFLLILSSFSCKRETYSEVVASNSNENLVGRYVVSYLKGDFNIDIGNVILFNSDNTLTVFYSNYYRTGTWEIKDKKFSNSLIECYDVSGNNPDNVYDIVKLSDKELILNIEQYAIKLIKE